MKFVSTRNTDRTVSLREAVMQGLADDGGLFMPETIPAYDASWWDELSSRTDTEIASALLSPYLEEEFTPDEIQQISKQALTFPLPLARLDSHTRILELFHGPTLAFKDVGARFLAAVMERLMEREGSTITILTATSGDTGSAVAQAFYGSKRINVVVLYPAGKVTEVQQQQIATLGGNITALEVEGNFDDCQRMVKEAFGDAELRRRHKLTSANSINIMRLLPQMIYYAAAYRDCGFAEPVFSVPSGNFGNLTAGLLAHHMGMPVRRFIAACNANHVFPDFLESGIYTPHPGIATHSNAMDVGDPSNFERMQHLFDNSPDNFRAVMESQSFDDSATLQLIADLYNRYGYLADPHTAVGLLAWQDYLPRVPEATGIVLATAHPAKFGDSVRKAIGREPDIPERLARHLQSPKLSTRIPPDTTGLTELLDRL